MNWEIYDAESLLLYDLFSGFPGPFTLIGRKDMVLKNEDLRFNQQDRSVCQPSAEHWDRRSVPARDAHRPGLCPGKPGACSTSQRLCRPGHLAARCLG